MTTLKIKRSKLTKKLEEICTTLDENNRAFWSYVFRQRYKYTSNFEVKSLWVAGSYARGAVECGDLDLIIELATTDRHLPSGKQAAFTIFKKYRNVSFFGGTPNENESGIEITDAILVWQDQGFDWRSAIASIRENPSATRFLRKTDAIPFLPKQLSMQVEDLEKLVELRDKGIIDWCFTPIEDLEKVEPEHEDEIKLTEQVLRRGVKTQQLSPYLLSFFKRNEIVSRMIFRDEYDKSRFAINGSKVFVGQPRVPIHLLDSITTCEVAIFPHLTSVGHNGIWSIKRGDNHPLVISATEWIGYYIGDENQKAEISLYFESSRSWAEAHILDLFKNKQNAEKLASELNVDSSNKLEIMKIEGSAILDLLSFIDILTYENHDYSLTRKGSILLNSESETSTADLISVLNSIS